MLEGNAVISCETVTYGSAVAPQAYQRHCTSVSLEADGAEAKCRYVIPSINLLLDVTVLGIWGEPETSVQAEFEN